MYDFNFVELFYERLVITDGEDNKGKDKQIYTRCCLLPLTFFYLHLWPDKKNKGVGGVRQVNCTLPWR